MKHERLSKMPFWELANGRMAEDLQKLFERAQITALNRDVKCKVKLIIEVSPPDPQDPTYGHIRYQTDFSEPAFTSRAYNTVLHNGMIVANPAQVAPQLDLLINKEEDDKPENLDKDFSDAEIIESDE